MKNIIITGATGFIGGLLVEKFYHKGYHVTAIVRDSSDISGIEGKAEILINNGESWENIGKIIGQTEEKIFYHLAWQGVNGSDKGNIDVQLSNISQGIRVAKFAEEIGCTKFLCAGSVAEMGLKSTHDLPSIPSGLLYAAAKQSLYTMLAVYCKNIKLPFVWMQFSNVYGEQNKTGNILGYTLENILNNREACFGPAQQLYDLISANDLVEAVYRLGISETKRDFYFIGSGTPRKLGDYLIEVGKIAGKEEWIKIGSRPDDGIRYCAEMFDNLPLVNEIGEYVTESFEEAVKKIVYKYRDGNLVVGDVEQVWSKCYKIRD